MSDAMKEAFDGIQEELALQARSFVKAFAASALAAVQTSGGAVAGVQGATGQVANAQGASSQNTASDHLQDTDRGEAFGNYNVMSNEDQRSLRAKLDASHTDLARAASTALGFATLQAQVAMGINMNGMADHRDQNHNQDRKTGVLDFIVLGDAAEESANDTDRVKA